MTHNKWSVCNPISPSPTVSEAQFLWKYKTGDHGVHHRHPTGPCPQSLVGELYHGEFLHLNHPVGETWTAAAHISPHLCVCAVFPHQETCLRQVSEGLQLHRTLLGIVANHLKNKDLVLALQADVRDLNVQIVKVGVCVCLSVLCQWPQSECILLTLGMFLQMLKMVGEEVVTPSTIRLNLRGDYEIQVAAHLTLLQLQTFGQDVDRCLKSLDQSSDQDTDDNWSRVHAKSFVCQYYLLGFY